MIVCENFSFFSYFVSHRILLNASTIQIHNGRTCLWPFAKQICQNSLKIDSSKNYFEDFPHQMQYKAYTVLYKSSPSIIINTTKNVIFSDEQRKVKRDK